MAEDFQIKIHADLDSTSAEQKLNALTKERKVNIQANVNGNGVNNLNNSMQQAQKNANGLSTSLKDISTAKIKVDAINAIKEQAENAVKAVTDLNQAMTLVNMTMSNMTDASLNSLKQQSLDMAKELSTYTKTVTDAITIYANENESTTSMLAKAQPTVLLSAASGMTSSSAADAIQGIMNQFDLAEDQAMHVADVTEKLSSEIALDFSKGCDTIAKSIAVSGSVVNEAGMDFEKYAAIVSTVAENTRQSGSTIGNAFKTIFSRISRSKDGLTTNAEMSKAEEAFNSVGVSVRGADGDLRDVSDTLDDLNEVWGTLNKSQKSHVAEEAAGIRQKNMFISMMDNYNKALQLEKDALDSSGTAMEINDKRADSVNGRLEKLSATMTKLYSDALPEEAIEGMLDFATAVAEVADKVGLLQGAFAALGVAGVGKVVNMLSANWTALVTAFTSPIGITSVAVGGLVAAISAYRQSIAQAVESAKQAGEAWQESNDDIQSQIDKITELRMTLADSNTTEEEAYNAKKELFDIQQQLNSQYGSAVAGIDLVNGSLKDQIDLLNQASEAEANKFLNENRAGINEAKKKMTSSVGNGINGAAYLGQIMQFGDSDEAIQEILKKYADKGISTMQNESDGTISIYFTGDATQAESVLNDFMTEVRAVGDEFGDSFSVDSVLENTGSVLKDAEDRISEYGDLYNQARQAELLTQKQEYKVDDHKAQTAAKWLKDYTDAINAYNNALVGGDSSQMEEAANNFEAVDRAVNALLDQTSMSEWADQFTDARSKLNDAGIAYQDFYDKVSGKDLSDKGINSFVEDLKDLNLSDVDFKYALETDGIQEGEDAIQGLTTAAENAGIPVDTLIGLLTDLGVISSGTAESVDEIATATDDVSGVLEGFLATQDNINAALAASLSATGLSAEQITNVANAYSELEGYNPAELFEVTANGVHLNASALRELQAQQTATAKSQFASEIERQNQLLDEQQQKISDLLASGASQDDILTAQADASGIQSQIDSLIQLQAQLDGATSAYQRWLDAQSNGEEGDMYDSFQTAIKRGDELLSQGLVGTNEFRAIADLFSSEDLSTAPVEQLVEAYNNASPIIKSFFTEGAEGANNFIDKMIQMGYATEDAETGLIDFSNVDTKQIADELGVDVEAVEAIFKKLGDYGFDIKVSANIDDVANEVTSAKQRLDEINGYNATAEVKIDATGDEQIQHAAELIASLPEEKQIEIGVEEVGNVDSIVQQLVNQPDSINIETTETKTVNEQLGETVDTVPDAEGTANFSLGNSPMTVPSASGVANFTLGDYPTSIPSVTQNVIVHRNVVTGTTEASGTMISPAHADGNVALKHDEMALSNEQGQESIVRNGKWQLLPPGAHIEHFKKNDIIFNASQTKQLMQNGKISGYGKTIGGAYANGTYNGMPAHANISASGRRPGSYGSGGNSSVSSNNSGNSGSTITPSYTKKKASSSKSISTKVSKAIEKISKWVSKHFDWIEVKIDHLQKKADSYYTKAQNAIDLGLDRKNNYKSATSNMQKSIATNEELITANQQGASRYQKEANTVKRKYNKKLKKNDKKVFNEAVETLNAGGTIDISAYSANVKTALEDYKKYYDSAQSCRSAVDDLNSTLIEQKQALFNLPIDQATAKVDKLEVALSKLQLRYAKLTAGKNVKPSVENNELETELKNQGKQVNAKKNAAKTTKSTYEKEQQKVDNAKKSKPQNEAKQKEAKDKAKDQAKDILSNSKLKKVLTKSQKADLKKGKSITLTKKQKRKLNRSQKNKVKAYNNTVKTADTYKGKTAKDLATIKNGNKSVQIAKDANDKAQQEANDAEKDYINQKVENEKTKIDNIDTYYSNRSENEDQKNALAVAKSGRDNPKDLKKQIKLGEQKINAKKKQLDNSVDKGIIKVGSKEWYEIWNGILADEKAVENQKVENSKNKFDNAGAKLQDKIDSRDKKQAADIAKSGIDQTADRSAQIKWSKKVLKAKQDQFDKNKRNGSIKEGSDEWYRQQNEIYEAQEKLAKEEIENAKGKFDNITSEYGKKKDLAEKKAALKTARSGNENATDYTEQINVTSEELGKMQHKFKEAVNSKAIKEGTDAWYEMQQQIIDVQTELQNLQVESEKTKFKNITGKYDNQLDLLKKNSDRRTASGAYESVRAYDAQISKTTGELKAMQVQLQKSVDSGVIKVGTDAWYEMQSQIVDVETELGNLHESARKAKIDEIFTRAAESVQKLIDRLQTVQGLITDEMKFDKDGNITKSGALSMMLDSKSLEDSKKNFKTYVKERDYILNTSWKAKGYKGSYVRGVDSELDSLLDDVDSKIQSEIGNIQNYTESLLNTVISANEKERDAILEVVDAHKEALSKKKDYYDYDKKMKSQNKTISDLERQAAGLRGSTDKADIAQLQKIEAQLADAKDERDDMVKDHLYEMQTDALDQISTDINKNYSDMIDAIKASPKAMSDAITQFMKDNGITASGLASSISSVLSGYLDPNGKNKTQTKEDINKSGLAGNSGTTTLSKEQQTKVDAFRKAVKNLGTKYGSSDMDATVKAADKAYAALSSTEKSYVSADYQTLKTAKTTHNNKKTQNQQAANLKAFQNAVKNLGTDYGSTARGKRITTAENAYKKLTPEQKKTVAAQYTTLTTAKKNHKEAIDPNNVASVKTTSKTNNTASKATSKAKTAAKDTITSATSTGIATKSSVNNKVTSAVKAATSDVKSVTAVKAKETTNNTKNKVNAVVKDAITKTNQGNGKINVGDRVSSMQADWVYQYSNKALSKNKKIGSLKRGAPYYIGEYKKNDAFPIHLYSDAARKHSVGWVRKDNLKGYASGTPSVKGDQLAWVNENWQTNGGEIIYRKSDGAMLMPLGNCDTVFSADKVQALYKMLETNPLPMNMGNVFTPRDLTTQIQTVNNTPVNYSDSHDIIVQGDLTRDTLPNLQEILKKSSEYTQNEIRKDLVKAGRKKTFH